MNESKFRKIVRELIKEEVTPSERRSLKHELSEKVSQCIDDILISNGVHKKGLSSQQASTMLRVLLRTIDEKLDEFTSQKRPREFKNYREYIEKYNL